MSAFSQPAKQLGPSAPDWDEQPGPKDQRRRRTVRGDAAAFELFVDAVAERVIERLGGAGEGGGEPWLKLSRAAEYADCSPDTVLRAIKNGRLRGGKAGDDWRTRRSCIDLWISGGDAPLQQRQRPQPAGEDRICPTTRRILASVNGGKR